MSEHDHRRRLAEARKKYQDTKKIAAEAKTLVKSATPWGVFSLLSQFNLFADWVYAAALAAAIFKDFFLDLIFGFIPAVGAVITWLVSIFIFFMMILSNTLEKDRTVFQRTLIRYITRFLILILVTICESIPAIEVLPLETIGVIAIYLFTLAARKNAEEVKKKARTAQASMEEEYV
ncbi:MAG: hypothetical protein NT136_00650 [Candidatus Moranbacteria bacterium]|nr:hypothetical protein [Candidatus Moranbacteria bacterium]